jgi:hypothetical protein
MFALRSAAALLAATATIGCTTMSGKPVQAYAGTERPVEQVAHFECGFGLRVKAIDGDSRYQGEPITCKFAVLPGNHEFRAGFESRDYSAHGNLAIDEGIPGLAQAGGRPQILAARLPGRKAEAGISMARDAGGQFPQGPDHDHERARSAVRQASDRT